MINPTDHERAQEAKSIVALAFRNGPIENVHAGKRCSTCSGNPEFSHIADAEMKEIMQYAVDRVYELLSLKAENPGEYAIRINGGALYTLQWDDPTGLRSVTRPISPESSQTNMRELNRSAVIVSPKQPFLDWMHRIDPTSRDLALADITQEPSVYLLEACESEEAFERRLRKISTAIFEDILYSWWTEASDWPKDRTFRVFRTWFAWEWYSMVADLSERPLLERDG